MTPRLLEAPLAMRDLREAQVHCTCDGNADRRASQRRLELAACALEVAGVEAKERGDGGDVRLPPVGRAQSITMMVEERLRLAGTLREEKTLEPDDDRRDLGRVAGRRSDARVEHRDRSLERALPEERTGFEDR